MTSGTEGPGRGHRRRVASLAVIALVTAGGIVGFACGFSDEGSFLRPEPEMDSSPLPEASTIPRPDGSIVEKDVDVPAPTCPTAHGGMVIVDAGGLSFCIDSTEVTNAEYDTFLSATDGGSVEAGIFDGGLADGCDSNLTFARITADPATFPVDQVDWCDAYAFCKWAGKRLCGKTVDGDASSGEWFAACTNGGQRGFPYGADYDAGACNDNSASLTEAGSLPGCQGSVPKLFDMNGNATELIDACDASTCLSMGGAHTLGTSSCSVVDMFDRATPSAAVGFRCCANTQ